MASSTALLVGLDELQFLKLRSQCSECLKCLGFLGADREESEA